MKRKGEEFANKPVFSVVVPQNDNEDEDETTDSNFNSSDSSSTTTSSSFNLRTTSWEAAQEAMRQLMEQDNVAIHKNMHVVNKISNSIRLLGEKEREIHQEADKIDDQIQNSIQECSKHFSQEEEELHQMRKHVDNLENEVDEIRDVVNQDKEEESQLKKQIEHYLEQANERVEEIDEVEVKKKEEVYRLRTQISLHAHVTGIKWDYDDDIDSMVGEIDIPSKQVQKRFAIDRENRSSFEVVNQVWTMMEA